MASAHVIPVATMGGGYEVHVGAGLLDDLGALAAQRLETVQAFIVTDTNVAPLYLDRATASLARAGIACASFAFPAGEQSKTIATWSRILAAMADAHLDRTAIVVALGGGVTGDMAGFAAAAYMRGIRVVQVPTTLLAMVDSSVGGKTGVDLPHGKNLVGAFLQPELVVADIDTLSTLPDERFIDACGEVIKHAVLADPALFAALERSPLTSLRSDAAALAQVVARNVEIKRDVVEHDERERGLRQTLNLGHTVGHAIEAASGFALGHGSCVAAGLCIVCRAAAAAGRLDAESARRIHAVVAAHGLPTGSDADPALLASYAGSDKKRRGGIVNLVVPTEIGRCDMQPVGEDELAALIARHAKG